MARKRSYRMESGGPERLVIAWTGIWKNVEVRFDGALLGEPIPTFKALKEGREYRLPDGRALSVRFRQQVFGAQGLEVLVEGRPLPGSDFDPRQRLKLATGILWFVAGLSALLGVLGMAGVDFFASLGFGWPSLVAGVVLGALAYVGHRFRAPWAFMVALGLLIVDTVISLSAMVAVSGGRVPMGGIYLRVALIVGVAGGIKAAMDARKADRADLAEAFH